MRRLIKTMRKPRLEKRDTKKARDWTSKKLQDEMVVEDDVTAHGEGCKRSSPQPTGVLGCEKSCRLRWINDSSFGEDEEDLIIKLHALLGNRWSLIAGRLPGRTDNEVENYWNSQLKRKLISTGIDPNNHRIYHTLPRRKNQIPEISSSDNSSTCATSAVSKALKYHGQNKLHIFNGTGNIELSGNSDKEASELPDLSLELPIMKSSATLLQ